MTEPKPGDRVRGWIEGTVLDTCSGCVAVENYHVPWRILTDVEILPPPELEWQVGDLVLDADGIAWRRGPYGPWYSVSVLSARADAAMIRPLRRARIVPEDGDS